MDLRERKGLEIAARMRVEWKDGAWLVPSQTGTGKYCVVLKPEGDSCECEDFTLTGKPCKHVHAARLVRERERGSKSPLVVDAEPKKPTYRQLWPAYNLAQSTEKHRFQVLLHDLSSGIPEPLREPKSGPKPHRLQDAVFAMVLKVYSTFSSRRSSCDLKDAHARGYTTRPVPGRKVNSFFENAALAPTLQALIVRSSLPLRAIETAFAPDSTGFSTNRFVRWYDEKYGVTRQEHDWVKAHIMTGVKTNIITAVEIHGREAGDFPQFKPLVETTAASFRVQEVPADKAYLGKENLELVDGLGGTAFIPFKVNSVAGEPGSIWERMFHYYQFRREDFLKHYHQRSNAESTIAMVKAKFRDHVRSKTAVAMKNEVLCKFLAHNICCVILSQCELGIEPVFWPEQPGEEPVILRLPQDDEKG